jgi:hypothetical protein
MIFFVSDGGLGNQIFQYAFLNTIARKGERVLCLDMAEFAATFDVEGSNGRLVVSCSNLLKSRIGRLLFFKILKPLSLFSMRALARTRIISYVCQEKNEQGRYVSSFAEHSGLLPFRFVDQGYFQAERFFSIEALDFRIKKRFEQKALQIASQVPQGCTKVFVHIRRGDYLHESFLGEQGIDLPKIYFSKAIDMISKELKRPFFIFLSDDPSYTRDCFSEVENKLISKENMQVDLALMTLCEYGVTSNSSFSWWGAWLMKKHKKVIFPKYWYGWKAKVLSHPDIVPPWGIELEC